MPLTEEGALQNRLRFVLMRDIAVYGGDSFERVADYGRIILFLLSRAQLTPEEAEVFSPLEQYMPDADSLRDVVNREAHVQKLVRYAKTHPREYMEAPYHG